MPGFYEWLGADLLLRLKVQPKASKDEFCEVMDNSLKVRITAPPVEGKANRHIIKFLARQFKVSRSQIEQISGVTSREKRFKVSKPGHLPTALKTKKIPPKITTV